MTNEHRDPKVRELVWELVESSPPAPPLPEAQPTVAGRRRPERRRVLISAVAALAVIATSVGAFALIQRADEDGPRVSTQPGQLAPDDDETLYLVPRFVPDGIKLLDASGGNRPNARAGGGGSASDWLQHYVRFDATREHPVEILDIQWGRLGSGVNDEAPFPLPPGAERVTVRGHEGSYDPAYGMLVWEEPEERFVSIQGVLAREAHDQQGFVSLPLAFLLAVADELEPRAGGGFRLPDPPGGFELVAEQPGKYSEGMDPRTLMYGSADGRGFQLQLVDDSDVPPGANLYLTKNRLVPVRGHEGVLSPFPQNPAGSYNPETFFLSNSDLGLEWLETPDVKATLSAVGLSEAELFAIAEGLERVDTRAWFALKAMAQVGATDPQPATTDPVTTSSRVAVGQAAGADEAAIREAFLGWLNNQDLDVAGAYIEDFASVRDAVARAAATAPLPLPGYRGRVDDVQIQGQDEALVAYSIFNNGAVVVPNNVGRAVKVDGMWKVSRETICAAIAIGGVTCPP